MFERTYYATHPDMMECVSNEELRDATSFRTSSAKAKLS